MTTPNNPEQQRLQENATRARNWQRWGTYLPERQWGTYREDYSPDGSAWESFPYEMAQYRAYRWGEDGLLGWTDRQCRLCFSLSVWNGKDSMLKERLFGLTNQEGNHGEDVKELFYYLDATPTHSFCKALYKYPQAAFPYESLRAENRRRGLEDREYELLDTGVFDQNRYFDLTVEYAKADVEDTLIRLTAANRGTDAATLALLPTLTLRNNWSWRDLDATGDTRPVLTRVEPHAVRAEHKTLGTFLFTTLTADTPHELLLTENDSNLSRLDPQSPDQPINAAAAAAAPSKDALDRYVVHGDRSLLKQGDTGTKCAFVYRLEIPAGESRTLHLRLVRTDDPQVPWQELDRDAADALLQQRQSEADTFYGTHLPAAAPPEQQQIARQAYAGLLWCKQFYYYVAERWMEGDEAQIKPAPERADKAENWRHLFCRDVLSMPDKWEYPWFAAWDLAFHMIPMAQIDPEFAKAQLLLLLREWYMHPNGQLPAYESNFSAVNPPVHAWAVWHVYRSGSGQDGVGDLDFLERAFQKLMLNFTWWVNRNDAQGRNLFNGGFLGLDNIGVFDRSEMLPGGATLNQADATAWMGLYCSVMLQIALELARHRSTAYEDIASKFFEHYVGVIDAINNFGGTGLWNEEDGFYFDQLNFSDKSIAPLRVRTVVGIVPLFAVCILQRDTVAGLKGFLKRLDWFLDHKPHLSSYVLDTRTEQPELQNSRWIAIAPKERFEKIIRRLLDEAEFLSPHGIRALSKAHQDQPFQIRLQDHDFTLRYVPAESDSTMFGGNSNWRGPVWFPINMLVINALERYFLAVGDQYRVEFPTGSGEKLTLGEVADALRRRLIGLFVPAPDGQRPCHGGEARYAQDPHWKQLILFSEYFSGDDGRGVGASHQTGWTALVASMIGELHSPRGASSRGQ